MNIDKKNKKDIIELIIIFGIVLWCVFNYTLFFKIISYILKLITPIIVGIGIAFILNVPMKAIEKKIFKVEKRKNKKLIRILSLLISVLLIFGLFGLIFLLIIPEFIDAVNNLLKNLPDNLSFINDIKDKLINIYPSMKEYLKNVDTNMVIEHSVGNAGNIISIIVAFLTGMVSKLITGFIGFILAIYILADKENFIRTFNRA